ncbi:hypothetical protein B2J88_18975 [Rhodococcus sp. SRB_17]|uniref:hypothetical protein n=1 Tax=Acidovorax sp. SRB_24 TaxID=1962700 RepID=UPI00145CE4F2|nr:hypothetical protein [Acidovorax sp. SRB_24]NMM76077.1 hypothetical protein [Acidovorax sp. SRB_24]NMM86420.1 hypothetical protein [Rhodococcus sp. SRB_17]
MSWIGEATGLWGVLSKGWDWWRDPARLSAQRLIRAFEAHGVARQQIIRLVPTAIAQAKPELGMADCSSPEQLKPKLTPALLDWAAGYLNLRRDWLDGREDAPPHMVVDHYKHPARYGPWLQARKREAPEVQRYLSVWKAHGTPVGPVRMVHCAWFMKKPPKGWAAWSGRATGCGPMDGPWAMPTVWKTWPLWCMWRSRPGVGGGQGAEGA